MVAQRNGSGLGRQGMYLRDNVVVARNICILKNKGHGCLVDLFVFVRRVAMENHLEVSKTNLLHEARLATTTSISSPIFFKRIPRTANSTHHPAHPIFIVFSSPLDKNINKEVPAVLRREVKTLDNNSLFHPDIAHNHHSSRITSLPWVQDA